MSSKSKSRSDQAFRCVENMLRHARPKQDNAAIMKTLRERFVSAEAMFSADAYLLEKCGLHPHDALLMHCMPAIARYSGLSAYDKSCRLDRLSTVSDYLITNFHGFQEERFYMLHLDARGRLITSTLLQEGMSDCSLFNLKKLLSDVVRVSPKAVIISHNHPACTLRPSQEDLACTMDALRALSVVGVPLLDHIIIAGKDAVSLRENGFIPAVHWLRQAPENRMLQNYLLPIEENPPVPRRKKTK